MVVVDRYSGWPTVVKCKEDSSDELVRALRGMFVVYGAPEELATDGASVFMSGTNRKFLEV